MYSAMIMPSSAQGPKYTTGSTLASWGKNKRLPRARESADISIGTIKIVQMTNKNK